MSTNFYFLTDNEGPFKYKYGSIHIGQRAAGWEPLFQVTEFYSDFKQLVEFYSEESKHLLIVDEYDRKYSWREFIDELLTWGVNTKNIRKKNDISHRDEFGYAWLTTPFT